MSIYNHLSVSIDIYTYVTIYLFLVISIFLYLSIYPCLSIYLYLSIYKYLSIFKYRSIYLINVIYLYLPIPIFIYLSIDRSFYPYLSIYLSIYLYIPILIYLCIYPFIYLSKLCTYHIKSLTSLTSSFFISLHLPTTSSWSTFCFVTIAHYCTVQYIYTKPVSVPLPLSRARVTVKATRESYRRFSSHFWFARTTQNS
jgi:hypothetical protein